VTRAEGLVREEAVEGAADDPDLAIVRCTTGENAVVRRAVVFDLK